MASTLLSSNDNHLALPDLYPKGVKVARVADDLPISGLTNILQGQDAAIATIKGSEIDVQKRLADAAVQADVKRFIPEDFGSCDSSSPLTQELVPLYKNRTEIRDYAAQLSKAYPYFDWTTIVCGHFFDYSPDFIRVWPQKGRADILDDGERKSSASTLERVGEATARILERPEETRDRMVYVQSFCVSQNEVIAAFERVMGRKLEVRKYDSEAWRDEHKARAEAGEKGAVDDLVWFLWTVDAD
jgi:hypothetical protein